jgi:hypothetical protein
LLRKPSKSEGFSLLERREQVVAGSALPPGATKPNRGALANEIA